MTPKQIAASKRLLAKLKKIEAGLMETDTSGCEMLVDVNRSALESNRQCQRTITMWHEMIARNTGVPV